MTVGDPVKMYSLYQVEEINFILFDSQASDFKSIKYNNI